MKFTLFFLLCSFIQVQAAVFSQSKVSLQMQNVTLDKVFRELSRQVNCDFLYNHSVVKEKGNVSVNVNDEELNKLLDDLLPAFGMEYVVDEKVIIIREKLQLPQNIKSLHIKGKVVDIKGDALPGVNVRIKGTNIGTMTKETGEFSLEVPADVEIILVFSFVGMKQTTLKYVGQKEIKITMYEDIMALEDVVVTGYQVIDKRKLTSSIATVKAEDLDKMGALTVDQMLEGKAPGLMIMNMSAQPGAATKVRVRAGGTFTGNREPLWVIDGVIYEDPVPLSAADINSLDKVNLIGNAITGLNPQDIDQIDILKDASATAIYGTRAANGVIVVTTKRGKSGSLSLNYSGSLSWVDRPRYSDLNLMNSKERIDVSREIAMKNLYYPTDIRQFVGYEGALKKYYYRELDYAGFQQEVARLEEMNTDWFGELYRKALTHSHSVNLSGGNEKIRVYAGLSYDNQVGTELHVGLYRMSGRINTDFNLRKNVLISLGLSGSTQKATYNHPAYSVFDETYNMSRAVPARDEEGELLYMDKPISDSYSRRFGKYNILNELDNSGHIVWNKDFNAQASIDWEIIKGLRVRSQFSFRTTSNMQEQWMTEKTFYLAAAKTYADPADKDEDDIRNNSMVPFGGIYTSSNTGSQSLGITTQINYNKSVAEKHHFNLNIGQEANSVSYIGSEGWTLPGYNHEQGRSFIQLPMWWFTDDEYEYKNMVNWMSESAGNSNNMLGFSAYPKITDRVTNTISFFGIFNYQFENRYIFNFNMRSDGSNRFGQYQRYKFRPAWSTSLRWNIHAEHFMASAANNYLDELAIRLSYGFRGTMPTASPYLVIQNYGQSNADVSPEYVSELGAFPNANLRWERTKTFNVGLNHSWLNGRISGALDYAYSRSLDLLLTRPVSLVNGSATQLYNGGSKEDHTFELNLLTQNIKTSKFQWNMNFNITRIKENILDGYEEKASDMTVRNFLNGTIYKKGFPLDGFYSYRFTGLDEEGLPTFANFTESSKYNMRQEWDNQLIYDEIQKALVYEGNRLPKFYGGFGTELKYANFTLSSYFVYKVGQKVRLLELYNGGSQRMPMPHVNMSREFVDRWKNPGDEAYTNIPVLSNELLINNADQVSSYILPWFSTYWWAYDQSNVRTAKGSYIRWQTLTLSYDLPDKYIKRLGASNLRFRFQVQNLGVSTFDKKLKGKDPEQVRSLGMPVLPSYNFSLSFSF